MTPLNWSFTAQRFDSQPVDGSCAPLGCQPGPVVCNCRYESPDGSADVRIGRPRFVWSVSMKRFLLIASLVAMLGCGRGAGGSATSPTAPTATNRAPVVASVGVSPQGTGIESVTNFTFSAQGASDPDGDTLRYSWASSDGTAINSSVSNLTYVYGRSGVFDMRVTVSDPQGLSASANVSVRVGTVTGVWDFSLAAASGYPSGYVVTLVQSGATMTGTMSPVGSSRNANMLPGQRLSSPRGAVFGVESGQAFWSAGFPPGDDSYFDMTVDESLTSMTGRCVSSWTGFACLNSRPVTARKR